MVGKLPAVGCPFGRVLEGVGVGDYRVGCVKGCVLGRSRCRVGGFREIGVGAEDEVEFGEEEVGAC